MDVEARLVAYIKEHFKYDCSGHDYFHSLRVYKLAMKIAETESCDNTIVMMSALLHDVDDVKLFHSENYENARSILSECKVEASMIERVIQNIKAVSYKGKDSCVPETIEGQIVQDADRLDSIGAIGIARAFAYGGSVGRTLYDPEEKPALQMSESEYLKHKGTTINHFYEKLLNLKDLLNTESARQIALRRQTYMEGFLEEFYEEWNGVR